MIRILFIVAILSLTTQLHAQDNSLKFEHISVDQGLSQNSVYCILQDRKGFIWFGTADGLDRYDGYALQTFRSDLSDTSFSQYNYCMSLHEDQTGTLWIGMYGGIGRVDGVREKLKFVGLPKNFDIPLSESRISDICEDKSGSLWLAVYGGGLVKYNPRDGSFVHFKHSTTDASTISSNTVACLMLDRDGYVWVGTEGAGIDVLSPDGKVVRRYRRDAGQRDGLCDNNIQSILQDRHGDVWVGTKNGGVCQLESKTQTFIHYKYNPFDHASLSNNNVTYIYEDNKGTLWFGTGGGGLNRFHSPTKSFERHTHDAANVHSLGGDRIRAIVVDRSENLWAGAVDAGVSHADLKRRKFNKIGRESDFTMTPAFIAADHAGNIWFGNDSPYKFSPTTNAVERIDPDVWNTSRLGVRFVRHAYKDKNDFLWFCTYSGLEHRDRNGKFLKRYTHNPTDERTIGDSQVTFAFEDRAGTFWVGLRNGGVDKFERARGEFVHFSPDGKPPEPRAVNAVITMAEDSSGNLWIGRGDALFKLSPDRTTFARYSFDPSNPRSLSNNTAICMVVTPAYRNAALRRAGTSEGELWVGTGLGVNRYNPATNDFTRYTSADGIANDKIWALLADNQNSIWVGSNRGLTKITVDLSGTEQFRNYDISDGLGSMEFNQNAAYKAQDGTMYFGNSGWLLWFHPDSVKDNPHIPQIVLTGFKKFDMPFNLGIDPTEVNEIRLAYEDNVISFQFAALEYTNPAKNQYAYKMEGFEYDWTYCGTRREVRYTHLSPGEYLFRVKGSNNDGVWNEEGLAIRVIIVPPFWRTWWFMGLSFIVIAGASFGSIRYVEKRKLIAHIERLERERALERERLRISKDMHDDIGANLTKIAIMSDLASRSNAGDDTTVQLQKISASAREVVDNISEIIWAINPKNDRLENLVGYIREHVSEFLEGTGIACQFDIPDELPDFPLSAEVRRNIFLVIKEALHNSVKHSRATEVLMTVRRFEQQIEFTIEDNGKGFSMEKVSEFSNGLVNMKKRIEGIGGALRLTSVPGKGTTIQITFGSQA